AEKYRVDIELQRELRNVQDHVIRVTERVASLRAILENALTVNATLVTHRQTDTALEQSEQVKKISGWAAILFGPTLVGTIYGMNFTHMPELDSPWGYPLALLAMVATSVALYLVFKSRRWM
ncbi:CorA family divalent cation transporter, partial [Microbacterium sp. zg.Y909]|uniref:CorA family divalent cation transporter n=1 Tax=Microbacterium sp. zg.Y909 TaxID=2969413 RepID=UPI0027D92E40